MNQGNGEFLDVSHRAGIVIDGGKGLGIVAADFNSDRRVDLFVANDGVHNFLFENTTAVQAPTMTFSETGMVRGVAVNGNGQSEACMGIVVEDFNADGFHDLFLTNFLDETNTLYAAASGTGIFEDVTATSGLGMPSLKMLGFGTQAIDGELDGQPDLIITNGHVDSYPGTSVPYRMVPQYFSNIGGTRFRLLEGAGLGEYFRHEYLGRSIVRLDWNRDGAEDLIVTHLDQPSALLTNSTRVRGNSLRLRLIATSAERDAFGTRITASTSQSETLRVLTSGGGYQASNEQKLTIGTGQNLLTSITVNWPSDATIHIPCAGSDVDGVLIEGRATVYHLPH